MRIELHLHTTRYSACATAGPEELMGKLLRTGYEAVFITEHCEIWRPAELNELRAQYPAMRIFSGVELNVGESDFQHLLILGASDRSWLRVHDEEEAIERAGREGLPAVLAHPFRWKDAAAMLDRGLLPDAIEYRTCNTNEEQAAEALAAAERLHIPVVNSGDVHGLNFVGRHWIETQRPVTGAEDLRKVIQDGAYRNCSEA